MFDDKYITTIGTKVSKKSITYERVIGGEIWDARVTLLIWDILGQKQYSRLHPVYYQGAEGALVVCNAADRGTVASLGPWASGFAEVVGRVPTIFLINRVDELLPDAFDPTALDALGASWKAPIMYVSPREGENVDRAFVDLGAMLLDRYLEKVGGLLEEAQRPKRFSGRPFLPGFLRRRPPRAESGEAEQIARAEIARIAAQLNA